MLVKFEESVCSCNKNKTSPRTKSPAPSSQRWGHPFPLLIKCGKDVSSAWSWCAYVRGFWLARKGEIILQLARREQQETAKPLSSMCSFLTLHLNSTLTLVLIPLWLTPRNARKDNYQNSLRIPAALTEYGACILFSDISSTSQRQTKQFLVI